MQLLNAGSIALTPAVYLPGNLSVLACEQRGQAAERTHRGAAFKAESRASQFEGVNFRRHSLLSII
jgi:hypothetical protein